MDATIQDIMATTKIRFVSFTDEQREKIVAKHPLVPFRTYAAGFWKEFPNMEPVQVPVILVNVIVRDDLSEELTYRHTKAIIENWDELAAAFPGAAAFDPEQRRSPQWLLPELYMHPGAIRYFREIGAEIPSSVIPPEMK